MISLYFLSLIPICIGGYLWIKSRNVVWWEWIISSLVALITISIIHLVTWTALTNDVETWSGQVVSVNYMPKWRAEWTEIETYTVTKSNGERESKTRRVHKSENHPDKWFVETSFDPVNIDEDKYTELVKLFGNRIQKKHGYRPNFVSGDRYDYWVDNDTGWIEPITIVKNWTNRIKASTSLFRHIKVSDDNQVFKYPKNKDHFRSSRLVGDAVSKIDIIKWDQMNSRLGPTKFVNVVMIGFSSESELYLAQQQEAKWQGGKKNDLVICYGGNPRWSYVFGWTDSTIVKRNLETIILNSEDISSELIPSIEKEISLNYQLKNWEEMNYLDVTAPLGSYIAVLIIMAISQYFLWLYFHSNSYSKVFQRR